jgi:peroxiredoxin (alkyl hydroperoxide reductase subunit C)
MVRFAHESDPPPSGRKLAATVSEVKALQHVRATAGKEAKLAGWEPRKPTLKPDLVGHLWKVRTPSMA